MKFTAAQLEKARDLAQKAYPAKIISVRVGQLVHPGGPYGFQFRFEDESTGLNSIKRYIDVKVDYEEKVINDPKDNKKVIERIVLDSKFDLGKVRYFVYKIFVLKKATLQLEVPNTLSYSTVEELLKSIGEGTYKKAADFDSSRNDKIDLSSIIDIIHNPKEKTIDVYMKDNLFYTFKVNDDNFELIRTGKYERVS
ncbi:MAG TPA: hypothetical protein DCZ94_16400 [Lentisphaeria bacterium]|nr:MAG: hypothetical protein A2X48_01935 [Lentisphaerae bacterium GWF2_49_21]HBC88529.1 hypothetical protein [Lentisphaeria bacterium]